MRIERRSPSFRLMAAMAMIALIMGFVVTLRLAQPDLGFDLAGVELADLGVTAVTYNGEKGDILGLVPATLAQLVPDHTADWQGFTQQHPESLPLSPRDFVEDPDMLPDYAAITALFQNQHRIQTALAQGPVLLVVAVGADVRLVALPVTAATQITRLPFAFWVQLVVGGIVLTVAAFLLALRPGMARKSQGRRGLVYFALAGAGVAGSAFCAAIYASRSLSIAPDLFTALSSLNHAMTLLFGFGSILLFASYPVRLIGQNWLLPLLLPLIISFAAYQTQILPIEWVRPQNCISVLFILILTLVGLQLRATWRSPADRAALMWLGMSVVLGSGVFVTLVALPASLGVPVVISQGLAFVPLCAIYIGTALALARYRLFELERWAWRVLFHGGTFAVLMALDLALISMLQLSAPASIASAALLIALVYFPLRDLVFDRFVAGSQLELPAIYRQTVAVALQVDPQSKERAWQTALETVFRPLHAEPCQTVCLKAEIQGEGVALVIPAQGWSRALRLSFADQGRRLFNKADVSLLQELMTLVLATQRDRNDIDKALTTERHRIARDLHDDVGARLLSALHAKDGAKSQEFLVDALADLRQIAGGLAGQALTLAGLIAEMRHEGRQRAQAHDVDLDWPLGSADDDERTLPYILHRNLFAIHREALSNALDHGTMAIQGCRITVQTELRGNWLVYRMQNPTANTQTAPAVLPTSRGKGRANMTTRTALLQGEISVSQGAGFYAVTLQIPLPKTTDPS